MQSAVASQQSLEIARSYKQLKVWQKALDLSLHIYALTGKFPKEEMYGLTSQMRRCAVSIPSNIAEGSERKSDKEFVRFIRIASGSLAELETQTHIAYHLGYIDEDAYYGCGIDCSEIGKMLHGLATRLNNTKD